MDTYRAKGGKGERDTETTINAHIAPVFGDVLVGEWRDKLAIAPALLRAGPKTTKRKVDADEKRARRATANRILTVLKAILNKAFAGGLVDSDDGLAPREAVPACRCAEDPISDPGRSPPAGERLS